MIRILILLVRVSERTRRSRHIVIEICKTATILKRSKPFGPLRNSPEILRQRNCEQYFVKTGSKHVVAIAVSLTRTRTHTHTNTCCRYSTVFLSKRISLVSFAHPINASRQPTSKPLQIYVMNK